MNIETGSIVAQADFLTSKSVADALTSEARLQRILRTSQMGICELELSTNLLTSSQGTSDLFHLEHLPVRPLADVLAHIHPDDQLAIAGLLRQPPAEFSFEFRICRAHGETRWIAVKGDTLNDALGKPVLMAGALVDITSFKHSQILLEQKSAELNRRVQELNCLFALSRLIEREDDLCELFREVVRIIPPAFEARCPVVARISHQNRTYCSATLNASAVWLSEDIIVRDSAFARLEVMGDAAFAQATAESDTRLLIRQIARKLGRAVERKLALDALRESEDRWRAMSSALREGVILFDQNGHVLTWNPSAERLLGLSAEEMRQCGSLDQGWSTVREDGSEFPLHEHPSRVTLRTGVPCNNVIMGLLRPGRRCCWLSVNSQPLLHPGQSEPGGVVVSFDDITERRQAEEALRQEMAAKELERNRLRAVLQALPVGVGIADAQGRMLELNEAARRIWGNAPLSSSVTSYSQDYKAWWPGTGERIRDHEWSMSRALSHGEVTSAEEIEIETAEGRRRTLLNYAQPILDTSGRIAGGVTVSVDITERKRSEEERRLLAIIAATSPDAIISIDLQGRVTSWNKGAEDIYGYTAEAMMGRSVDLILPDNRQPELDRALSAWQRGESLPNYETVRKRKDGQLIHVSVSVSPIFDAFGRLQGGAAITRDITERKRMEEQLQHNAFHDRLTGVPNRSLFMDRLGHVVARSARFGETYAVFVMDMDNFKLINDSFGHLLGDQLLCAFADRISRLLRPVDTLARFGGDEFTLLLEEAESIDAVEQVAARIIEALRPPFLLNGQEIIVSSSIGVTLGDASYQSADQAVRDADVALYEAKRQGKNQYVIFDSRMRGEAISRLYLESELRRALLETELSVEYQPIVDLQTRQVVGCEALARWSHPTMGVVEPGRFINVAEETGLITPLGRFVLERSAQALAEWLQQAPVPHDFYMSVNISPKEFYARDLVTFVQEVLRKNQLQGQHIRLEITETVIMQHDREASAILQALQDMGVQVCLDDFGTGYSSLSYLQQLPFNVIKVDRSFVQLLAEKRQSREIVRSILGLAQALNMQAIAEGAETPEQLDQVRALGFRWAQGFVLHRPMGRGDMARLLAQATACDSSS